MRTGYITLLLLLFTINLSAQSNSLFDLYTIPTYSSNNLRFYGQDFINYLKQNNLQTGYSDSHIRVDLGMDGNYIKQSPGIVSKITGSYKYYYNYENYITNYKLEKDTNISESSYGILVLNSSNSWYLNNDKGFFIFADPGISFSYDFRYEKSINNYAVGTGAGYGRVVGVRNIVQAYIIADELGISINDDELNKIAHIIDMDNDGYYYSNYRDSSGIKFYQDIAEITGTPGQTMKIYQILSSGLYKTTERYKGWEIRFGPRFYYENKLARSLLSSDDYSLPVDLVVSARYALPVDFRTQFTASVSYSLNLDNNELRAPEISASVELSFLHSYHWRTVLSANYSHIPEVEDQWNGFYGTGDRSSVNLNANSEFVLLNALSLYIRLSYVKRDYMHYDTDPFIHVSQNVETTEFHLGLNFYIL